MTGRRPSVVVGVDGSVLADTAARAAVEEARRRLLPVHVVRAFDWPVPDRAVAHHGRDAARRAAEAQLEQLRQALLPRYPGGLITATVLDGRPVSVLLSASEQAELLVLGASGEGPLADVLGPVRAAIARRSPVPVLAAAASDCARGSEGPVVVCADARDGTSTPALWSTALLEAITRSADLVVVERRHPPGPADPHAVDLSSTVRELQATAPGVRVRLRTRADGGCPALTDAAGPPQLLVVGRGRPAGPLPPAVRSALSQTAVPVLVVPPARAVPGPVRALALDLAHGA